MLCGQLWTSCQPCCSKLLQLNNAVTTCWQYCSWWAAQPCSRLLISTWNKLLIFSIFTRVYRFSDLQPCQRVAFLTFSILCSTLSGSRNRFFLYYKKMPCSFANKIHLYSRRKRTECFVTLHANFQANVIVNVPRLRFWIPNNFMPHCYESSMMREKQFQILNC
jgi:hypothetical protein